MSWSSYKNLATGFGFGLIGLFSLHAFLRKMLIILFPSLTLGQAYVISTKLVSTLQAVCIVIVALNTVFLADDIMNYKNDTLRSYVWLMGSYFAYDIVVMYRGFKMRSSENLISDSSHCLKGTLPRFLSKNFSVVVHHSVCLAIGYPVVILWRKGLGDFFVAVLFLAEVSTPFYSVRAILLEIGQKDGLLFAINGCLFAVAFFLGRIATLPFLFVRYAYDKNIRVIDVPGSIPKFCCAASVLFFFLQAYWFCLICRGLVQWIAQSKRLLLAADINGASSSSKPHRT